MHLKLMRLKALLNLKMEDIVHHATMNSIKQL